MNALSNHLARRLPFFYGYLMLPIAMLMQIGTSPGQTFAVSAFTPALLDSLGLSESRLGLAYMLGTVLAAVPLSMVGPSADRFGLRRVSVVVILALAGACLFTSTVNGFFGLLVAFFLLRFLGQGSLTLLSGNTTAMWFRNRIGRVSALLSIGSAVAFAFVPAWIAQTIEVIGWRSTYHLIAVLLVMLLLPLVLLLYRNRPEDVGQHVDGLVLADELADPESDESTEADRETRRTAGGLLDPRSLTLAQAMRTKSYYVLALANILWAMAGTGVLFYLFTLCGDRGLPEDTASWLFKILGFTMLAMQLSGGVLADFLPLNRLLGLGTSLVAAALIWLYLDRSVTGAQAFAALFGGGQGMLISVSAVAWLKFYGRDFLGSIRGAVWCGTVAGSGCGPLIMGAIKDRTGDYELAILVFAAAILPLSIATWFIRPPLRGDEAGAVPRAS
ncbi:MFS transporter [Roseiconus nitratireducens]|uniref:MFS transporter n=1 Tax=Roseiconus nitratireducens TaxID=2605748 RepID=A0A5M6DDD7_9BACT|nr:MFS transporter [Roseiconus nitratireducens]KAA5543195.1 MFS transporter [Roseiconus nitratireducens]